MLLQSINVDKTLGLLYIQCTTWWPFLISKWVKCFNRQEERSTDSLRRIQHKMCVVARTAAVRMEPQQCTSSTRFGAHIEWKSCKRSYGGTDSRVSCITRALKYSNRNIHKHGHNSDVHDIHIQNSFKHPHEQIKGSLRPQELCCVAWDHSIKLHHINHEPVHSKLYHTYKHAKLHLSNPFRNPEEFHLIFRHNHRGSLLITAVAHTSVSVQSITMLDSHRHEWHQGIALYNKRKRRTGTHYAVGCQSLHTGSAATKRITAVWVVHMADGPHEAMGRGYQGGTKTHVTKD